MSSERRQFPRFTIPENAMAYEGGRKLGRVSQAGGGGMLIDVVPEGISPAEFPTGRRLRVTVVEPATGARTTIDVIVRYANATGVGAEFITGREAEVTP
jgi:hypothetical protein